MKPFESKPGHGYINYNGYHIDIDLEKEVKIFEQLSNGKFKMRRRIMGAKAGHDNYGNQLHYTLTGEPAIEKAKNYIDEHIEKWEHKQSKNK